MILKDLKRGKYSKRVKDRIFIIGVRKEPDASCVSRGCRAQE